MGIAASRQGGWARPNRPWPPSLPAGGYGWAGAIEGGLTNFLHAAHSRLQSGYASIYIYKSKFIIL